jgi:hypothetical protein
MGGTVTVADFHQALKYTRTAAPYLSEEFKYKYLPTLIQEMKTGGGSGRGASGAGNTIASLYGMIAGRMIPKDLMQNWVDAGLIKRGMMVANKQHTGTSKILPGGIVGSALFTKNPLEWANQYAAPAIQKLMATKKLSEVDAYYALTKNRIAAFGLQTLVNKAQQFERDRKLIENASGVLAYRKLIKQNPQLQGQALHSQWGNLQTQIGLTILPEVLQGMGWLTGKLAIFNAWVEKNTFALKGLSIAFATLSGGLLLQGSIWLLTAAFRGLGGALLLKAIGGWIGIKRFGGMLAKVGGILGGVLLSGLRLATGAIIRLGLALFTTPVGWILGAIVAIAAGAYLIWRNWDAIKPRWLSFWEAIKTKWHQFTQWLNYLKMAFTHAGSNLVNGLIEGIRHKWQALKGTVIGMGSNIKSWFTAQLGIQSPSRVFVSYGLNIAEGAAIGIKQGVPLLRRTIAGIAGLALAAGSATASPAHSGSPYIATHMTQMMQVQSIVKLNERTIAEAVTRHQAREANKANSATPTFDPTMGTLTPTLNTVY